MSFSIVIPVLNEATCLPVLLDDIASQTLKPEMIIVSDCGSTDGTLDMLEEQYPDVVVVNAGKKSPAVARNVGSEGLKTDQTLFVDADISLPNGFCQNLLESHITSKADISYPKFMSDGKSVMGAVHVGYVRLWLWFWRMVKPEKGIGGVICIERNVFETLGKFDDGLIKGEDVDLYMKASRAGYAINYCNSVNCYVSSRRTRGFGIVRTFLADGPVFSRLRKGKRDYSSYK